MHTTDEVGADTFELRAMECRAVMLEFFEPGLLDSAAYRVLRGRAERAFEEFFRETRAVWRGIAASLLRRWRSPTEIDDVLQEIRLELWGRRFRKFDPEKSTSLMRVLRWGANVAGKRWVHQERGANKHGTRDKNRSRCALPFSSFGRDGEEDSSRSFDVPVEAVQERVSDALSHVRAIVGRCRTAQDRRIVRMLAECGGCVDEVLSKLRELRVMDRKIARQLVRETVVSIGCELADFRAVA